MFLTFKTEIEADRPRKTPARRRNLQRPCEECRRRKTRCDRQRPCEACRWYRTVSYCRYPELSRLEKKAQELAASIGVYETVFERLFPLNQVGDLSGFSAKQLLDLLREDNPERAPSPEISPPPAAHVSPVSPANDELEKLQAIPEGTTDDEDSWLASISDDVNRLSLSNSAPSTFLGASSAHAVFKAISYLRPDALGSLFNSPSELESSMHSSQPDPWKPPEDQWISPEFRKANELRLVDAFFSRFHSFLPLLDESLFRQEMQKERTDTRWLTLFDMVLALGSVAATDATDNSHYVYFCRSKERLDLDSFKDPNLETVQMLGLMGGHYLHHVSQPNLAYLLTGTALRMGISLGLHREMIPPWSKGRDLPRIVNLRRRVWWTLICLDTWGSQTLNRPSLGRWGPHVTAKLPHSYDEEDQLVNSPLRENVRFARIMAQIQEITATVSLISYNDLLSLDQQLLQWYDELPACFKPDQPCSEAFAINRSIIRWRYGVQRVLLHRPAFLSYSMRRVPYVALRLEERSAVDKCIDIAAEVIHDISSTSYNDQIWGTASVWFMFQASMVPLLALFIDDKTNPNISADYCAQLVELAISEIDCMKSWTPTGPKTLDCIRRIYETSRRSVTKNGGTSSGIGYGAVGNVGEKAHMSPEVSLPEIVQIVNEGEPRWDNGQGSLVWPDNFNVNVVAPMGQSMSNEEACQYILQSPEGWLPGYHIQ